MSRRIETGPPTRVVTSQQETTSVTRDLSLGTPAAEEVQTRVVTSEVTATGPQADDYIDRLLKYIPAEIIALYLGVTNVVPPGPAGQPDHWRAQWAIFAISAACVPIYLYFVTERHGRPLWSQLVISSIAFPVWVFAIGGPFREFNVWYEQHHWIAAVIISFATFLFGLVKPNPPAIGTT